MCSSKTKITRITCNHVSLEDGYHIILAITSPEESFISLTNFGYSLNLYTEFSSLTCLIIYWLLPLGTSEITTNLTVQGDTFL